jgi:hypothetical protein
MPAPIVLTRQSAADTARVFSGNFYRQAHSGRISLSQLLERMDPTSERPENERNLDAYERMLRAAGIVTQPDQATGMQSSTWEEATDTPQKRAMIPEHFARCWRSVTNMTPSHRKQLADTPNPANHGRAVLLSSDYVVGSESNPWFDNPELRAVRLVPPIPLQKLLARTTTIEGDAYRSLFVSDALGTDAYRMKRVAEASVIPTTTMVTGERTLRLYKFGRGIKTSYEQLRRQHIDRIAFLFQRMALQAEVDKVATVISTVVNGDGNANTAATVITLTSLDAASVPPTPTLKAWLTFKLRFPLTYQPDVLLAQEGPMVSLMLLPISLNNTIPLGYIQGMTPFGQLTPMHDQWANAINWGITADAPATKLLGWQSGIAVERVVEVGGSVAEVERFATDQTQIMVVSEVEGYGIIDPTGSKILNLV